jgi:hypothetical protein
MRQTGSLLRLDCQDWVCFLKYGLAPTERRHDDMADDAAKVATAYFDAWKENDFDTMRSSLDDDVTFVGPLAQLDGVDAYMKGIDGMFRITFEIVVRKTFVDGPDVLTGTTCTRRWLLLSLSLVGSTSRTARSRPCE